MKIILVVLALTIVGSQAISNDEALSKWADFQKEFEKSYKSPLDQMRKFSIFKENLEDIEKHNERFAKGEETWEKGINQFADWTDEEFLTYVNKFKVPKLPEDMELFNVTSDPLRANVDWRNSGAVFPPLQQGKCGACWAFSATGALEGQSVLRLRKSFKLSQQNLIDCTRRAPYNEKGCDGGWQYEAFLYVRDKGIAAERYYPYEGRNGVCRQKNSVFRAKGAVMVANTEVALANAVAKIGPISVGIDATVGLKAYKSGVFFDPKCTSNINHGVLAIGYGTVNGKDYWLIKNSWGNKWGDRGYYKLARNRKKHCGIATYSTYPKV